MVLWPAIHKKLVPIRYVAWIPSILLGFVLFFEYFDALTLVKDNPRVAMYLDDNTPFLERFGMPISHWEGAVTHFLFALALHLGNTCETAKGLSLVTRRQNHPDKNDTKIKLISYSGGILACMTIGLYPIDAFASGAGPSAPTKTLIDGFDIPVTALALLMAGWFAGTPLMLVARHHFSQQGGVPELEWPLLHPLSGFYTWLGMLGLIFIHVWTDFSLDYAPSIQSEVRFLITIGSLAAVSGVVFHSAQCFEPYLGQGVGRSRALYFALFAGTVFLYLQTYTLMYASGDFGNGIGVHVAALWIVFGFALIGLIGTLLPVAGFDAKPRPELWGWRGGLFLAAPLMVIINKEAIYAIPGLWSAWLISLVAPWVMEKDTMLMPKEVIKWALGLQLLTLSVMLFDENAIYVALLIGWIPLHIFRKGMVRTFKKQQRLQKSAEE